MATVNTIPAQEGTEYVRVLLTMGDNPLSLNGINPHSPQSGGL